MIREILMTAVFASALFTAPAFAQDADNQTPPREKVDERDIRQQERILLGLDSWNLTTGEAAKLEKGEARIDAVEAKDLAQGPLTEAEQTRINNMQDAESKRIYDLKHNDTYGNRNDPSNVRMEEDVKRDRIQEFRVYQAIDVDGADAKQVARLEKGEAHITALEAKAGSDDFVSKHEQARIQKAQDHMSKVIHEVRHNAKHK